MRNASSVLTNLRGDLETNGMRREQISTSLNILKSQLKMADAVLVDNKKEVAEREEAFKRARHELLADVDKTIEESGANFKEGRTQMVKSLAEYETACNKMLQGLSFLTEISDELMSDSLPPKAPFAYPSSATIVGLNIAPRFQIGQILHQGQFSGNVSSPMGTHYTSPMGTLRPVGNVRGMVA